VDPKAGPPPGQSEYVSDDTTVSGSTTLDTRDLDAAADQIVRGMLASPKIAGRTTAPILLIDADGWTNESSATMNLNMLADDIRTTILSKAEGRVRVVNREAIQQVEKERALKRDGTVGQGTLSPTGSTMGADYKLKLRITSHNGTNKRTGMATNSFQMAFEVIDLETAESIWASKPISVNKRGADDEVYQ
jgi:PBP1b-binding outer membrane lipoprotein LpoB